MSFIICIIISTALMLWGAYKLEREKMSIVQYGLIIYALGLCPLIVHFVLEMLGIL